MVAEGATTMNLSEKHLAVIGAGNIGQILLECLRAAGVPADHLVVCDSDPARAGAMAEKHGVRTVSLNDEAACAAEAILIATSPKAVSEVLGALSARLRPGQVVVSFAAAVPLSRLETLLPPDVAAVRVMPNAPSLVGQGMNPVAYGVGVTAEARELVEAILSPLGESMEVDDEQMNWCVGLTGAAMRSALPALEGMTRAGVEAGFFEAESRRMAAQALLGTAALALQTELTFKQIKSLTPMQTVDEAALAQLFFEAARTAKEKTDTLQRKLWPEETGTR
jgi:pyrroline-5-carboxylate reductase